MYKIFLAPEILPVLYKIVIMLTSNSIYRKLSI